MPSYTISQKILKPSKYIYTTRTFLQKLYGGRRMALFPGHGSKYPDMIFVDAAFSPYAPKGPGEPGILFTLSDTEFSYENSKESCRPVSRWTRSGTRRVFVCRRAGHWQYIGQYTMSPSSDLSFIEWKLLPSAVKIKWIANVFNCTQKYGRIRTRISLKGRGKETTEDQVDRLVETKRHKHLTSPEIRQAFGRGEEKLNVWVMKCVGYDVESQRELMRDIRRARARD